MQFKKSTRIVALVFALLLGAIISLTLFLKLTKKANIEYYVQPPTSGISSYVIEQKDITGRDYSYEMKKLDQLLPLAAIEMGLQVDLFSKQEIKGGLYYYEATFDDNTVYFELDQAQSKPGSTSFSLYQRVHNNMDEAVFIIGFAITHPTPMIDVR